MRFLRRCTDYIRMHGASYTLRRAGEIMATHLLRTDDRDFRRHCATKAELDAQRANLPGQVLLSIIVPVYNTRPAFLHALCDSFVAQSYPYWEACLYDGGSSQEDTRLCLDALAQQDQRIRVQHGLQNEGISGNTNRAAMMAQGDYLLLCDHDDTLAPDCLWRVARAICLDKADVVYTDEDKLVSSGHYHTDPHRKPDFCPDNLRSSNYICHLSALRKSLWDALGGMRPAFDGSQDHDLMLRACEQAETIVHIPHILYHWRTFRHSMSHQHLQVCLDAAARASQESMARIGFPGTCRVENGVLRLRYAVDAQAQVTVLPLPENATGDDVNRLAHGATATYLLFLAHGVSTPSREGIEELLMYAQRPDVCAVTPLLQDPRGRVLHAGYAIAPDGLVQSCNRGLPAMIGGWHGMNRTSYNVSAVSPACFLVKKQHFFPLDASMPLHQSMVQWCMQQTQRGLFHVYTPHCLLTAQDRSAFQPFQVAVPPAWHDPCLTGTTRFHPSH